MTAVSNPARVAAALDDAGVDVALLSTVPSVTQATGYAPSWEMWPGYNPHVPDPITAVASTRSEPVLLLPDYYGDYADAVGSRVEIFPTYSFREDVDQVRRSAQAIAVALGPRVSRLGYEPRTLSDALRTAVAELVQVESWISVERELLMARVVKDDDEIDAIRRACQVADLIQTCVAELAEPCRTEIDIASEAVSRAWRSAGRRFAILVQLVSGAASAGSGAGEPGQRVLADGDVICIDNAPWLDGVWGDSCNGVVVGEPSAQQERMAEAATAALQAGLAAALPGATAGEVDVACREAMAQYGYAYEHHSGHGIGYAHTEPPRIGPDAPDVLVEGMVLCLEPGAYVPDVGGFRHEHQFVVRADGPELLTTFEHHL
jgi:Xaa-Pro dipeptidase